METNETTAEARALMPDTDFSKADNFSQRAQLMHSSTTAAELAFHRPLEEALNASLALQPYPSSASARASCSNPPPLIAEEDPGEPEEDDEGGFIWLVKLEDHKHDNFNREMSNLEQSRAHGVRLAFDISEIPEDEREDYGDVFDRPMDAVCTAQEPSFHLYFKGMAIRDTVEGSSLKLAAIAVAICDPKGDLIHEIQKPVPYSAVRTRREVLEATALIEGLNAAISLGIKWLTVFCDYKTLINHVS